MRLAPVSCVLATGSVALVLGSIAAIGAAGVDEFVPIKDRVFFDRDALAPDPYDARRLVPLPEDGAGGETTSRTAARRGIVRPGAIVVAALGQSKGTDAGPRLWGEPNVLPWAPTPALPPLLSRPIPKGPSPATKLPVLEDPSVRVLEQALDRKRGRSHVLERHKAVSERGGPAISRLPLKHMSTRWTDPLAAPEVDEEAAPEFIMPFAKGRVTSLFNQGRRHPAIDLAGALGSPVLATTSQQTVIFAARRGGYGNAVITRDVYGWTHLYGHLRSITAKVGQVLEQGEQLGHLGSTGYSTGPHVHYEVRDGRGGHVNPVGLLFPGRNVGTGLAWADVGQFAASPQLASLTVSADRVASASAVEKTPPRVTAKRKAYPKKRKAMRYAYRVRRVASEDSD